MLKLESVEDGEFADVIAAEWESFENPLQPIFRLYCPIIDDDHAKSLVHNTQVQWDGYKRKRSSPDTEAIWLKVIDTEAGNKIVGGACWIFFKKYPPSDTGISLLERHPEGGARTFAQLAFQQIETLEKHKRTTPHAALGSFFTIPAYRRRGIGSMLMQRGIERIDELCIESFIEASPSGRRLYEKHGYTMVQQLDIHPEKPDHLSEEETAEWHKIASTILPVYVTLMHRPAVAKSR